MGMDLTLYLVEKPLAYYGNNIYPANQLEFDRNYRLFSQIQGFDDDDKWVVPAKPLPKKISLMISGDEGTKAEKTDPYGSRLTYTTAENMKKLVAPEDASDWNKTIVKMLQMLAPEVVIVLWWH